MESAQTDTIAFPSTAPRYASGRNAGPIATDRSISRVLSTNLLKRRGGDEQGDQDRRVTELGHLGRDGVNVPTDSAVRHGSQTVWEYSSVTDEPSFIVIVGIDWERYSPKGCKSDN